MKTTKATLMQTTTMKATTKTTTMQTKTKQGTTMQITTSDILMPTNDILTTTTTRSYYRLLLLFKGFTRHMAHRPSTFFMSVLYNLAKWLFLYSVYFCSLFFNFFLIFFLWPTGSFFPSRICFFLLCSSFFPSVHTQLFTIELFTMVLIT